MKIITSRHLDALADVAKGAPRKRKNLNLHPTDEFCCHRLFNAIEPNSYIRPHRHLDEAKDETFVIVRGALGVILFDEAGTIIDSVVLTPGGPAVAVDIPHGLFHGAVSLAPGTVFFEAKAGPYLPLAADETASWAPEEGTPGTADYLAGLVARLLG